MSQVHGTDAFDADGLSPPRGAGGELIAYHLEQSWATGGDPTDESNRPMIDVGRSQPQDEQIFFVSFPGATSAVIPVQFADARYEAWRRRADIDNSPPPSGNGPTSLTVTMSATAGSVAVAEQSSTPTAVDRSWNQSLADSVRGEGLPSSANAPTHTGPRSLQIAAHAAAFDDYASHQLPIGTSNNLYPSHAYNIPRAKTPPSADEVREGPFPSDKMLPFNGESSSRTSVDQERAAIEEILSQLRDPGSLGGRLASKTPESSGINSRSNLITDPNGFFVPDDPLPMTGNEIEGMILLPAAGDANECEYNLAGLFESGFEISQSPLGLEASVAIHQAIDTALDGVVQIERTRSQVHADDRPRPRDASGAAAGETERTSFPSAAATVGFVGLFGLVLLNRRNKPVMTSAIRNPLPRKQGWDI
jgi:hypothetical protein